MLRKAGQLLTGALAVRTAYLFVRYATGGGVARYEVESAAVALVVVGAIVKLAGAAGPKGPAYVPEGPADVPVRLKPDATFPYVGRTFRSAAAAWLAFVAFAFILYWPALSVGLLSDDYGLSLHAEAWRLGPVTRDLFRPLPLLVWSVILNSGGGAVALHALNITLHATNGFLTSRVVVAYGIPKPWAAAAGLLVLTAPLAPEAVVWNAGVFDLSMTTWLLAAALVARRYEASAPPSRRLALIALGVGVFLSKETGAVAPVLLLIDAWMRRAQSRALYVDLGALFGLNLLVTGIRLAFRFGAVSPPLTKYVAQRALFGAFGSLAVPWHQDALSTSVVFPLITGLVAITAATAFFLSRGTGRARLGWGAMAWIVVSILPVFPILFVPPDLQGSRYLYLGAIGWAVFLCAAGLEAGALRPIASRVVLVCLALLTGIDAVGTRIHLQHWRRAADLRDLVEQAAAGNPAVRSCSTPALDNLPDSLDGAYIFRTNAKEAFARDAGLTVTVGPVEQPCMFRWNEQAREFRQVLR